MKPDTSDGSERRFQAQLRHYHRVNTQEQQDWDEWIHGRRPSRFSRQTLRKLLIIGGTLLALAALGGLIAALFIELG